MVKRIQNSEGRRGRRKESRRRKRRREIGIIKIKIVGKRER